MILRTTLVLTTLASLAAAQTPIGARVETAPMPSSGDAADDAAIWVHPTDPSKSVVVCTDKQSGLAVYDLTGAQLQFLSDGEPNNVDLRQGFRLGGQSVTLVVASDRADNRMAAYVLDPVTRTLRDVVARTITMGMDIYGCCLYKSPTTGDFYFVATSKSGAMEQWRVFDNGSGRVDAVRVRSLDVGSDCEGCVADDETGFLFIGEEGEGVWRYGAEPSAGTTRFQVDSTSGSNLTADVEGLSIYYAANGKGYLMVSSQGDNTFSIYERQAPHRHVMNFEIVANGSIDGVTDCDGIDVMNLSMGSAFPDGLFVAQDGSNSGGNQNFKFLRWGDIAGAAAPLLIDPTYHPGSGTGSCTTVASATLRSGSNPSLLANLTLPKLGSPWNFELNCTGQPSSGVAMVFGYARSSPGVNTASGRLLVDLTSPRLFLLQANHGGGKSAFSLATPVDISFCGLTLTVQGACATPARAQLSTAFDVVLGS